MSEAWFGFLGVIVGAVVSLLGEQFTIRREREARQALRERERRDRRDTFQREAIIALQDALAEFWPLMMGLRLELGPPPSVHKNAEARALHFRISMLRARIFDDELQGVVKRLQDEIYRAVTATDGTDHARAADGLTQQMNNRMNTLLKEMI